MTERARTAAAIVGIGAIMPDAADAPDGALQPTVPASRQHRQAARMALTVVRISSDRNPEQRRLPVARCGRVCHCGGLYTMGGVGVSHARDGRPSAVPGVGTGAGYWLMRLRSFSTRSAVPSSSPAAWAARSRSFAASSARPASASRSALSRASST